MLRILLLFHRICFTLPFYALAAVFVLINSDQIQGRKSNPCRELSCQTDELCTVDSVSRNAICVNKEKLKEIENDQSDSAKKFKVSETYFTKKHAESFSQQQQAHAHRPRHDISDDASYSDCSLNELQASGARLLQWFRDMHKISPQQIDLPLHEHTVPCRDDVAWMFQQWDGNGDGELSIEELRTLETDKNEICIKPFIDRCDTEPGNDNAITLDEWCDCFAWVHDVRHEPPCHAAKHLQDPHLLDIYRPHCTIEGYYKAEQCHDNWCWCVDRYGREFESSRVQGHLPDCGQYSSTMNDEEKHLLRNYYQVTEISA